MIVGITGLIGSGKDTIADYLVNHYNFKRMSYAGVLKDAVAAVFHWDREMLEGSTKESRAWREQVDEWWANRLDIPHLSPRWVLQFWGTDLCRKHFHDDIWIASIEYKLNNIKDHIVISDCRFPNELASLKSVGATTIRVVRGENPEWYEYAVAASQIISHHAKSVYLEKLKEYNIHASEYSSVGLKYDYVIENNHTLEDLYNKVDSIIDL